MIRAVLDTSALYPFSLRRDLHQAATPGRQHRCVLSTVAGAEAIGVAPRAREQEFPRASCFITWAMIAVALRQAGQGAVPDQVRSRE